jgi:hypothetical protein
MTRHIFLPRSRMTACIGEQTAREDKAGKQVSRSNDRDPDELMGPGLVNDIGVEAANNLVGSTRPIESL